MASVTVRIPATPTRVCASLAEAARRQAQPAAHSQQQARREVSMLLVKVGQQESQAEEVREAVRAFRLRHTQPRVALVSCPFVCEYLMCVCSNADDAALRGRDVASCHLIELVNAFVNILGMRVCELRSVYRLLLRS